ncbi:TonB-dependent receptor domain-containing protein [Microbulbifer spongiae]|uniref:TonB-dependent receptor n=1 Tax=Microbulbifer spongiae TaxID=2944933 RepID=A0ABY9EH81_9GAMM|nr:TonB-dependent receptor [Microbulbifer sp. MI-G]WKD51154.1 TonB-dependent receptor [Microbulbifer sp. MI-G]
MIKNEIFQRAPLVLAIAAVSSFVSNAYAQEEQHNIPTASEPHISIPAIEEVLIQGRLQDSAQTLLNERLEEEVLTDMLGSEMISRVGDSTVAAALRRIPGLSLVNNKFVYVRGLGERYSSTTLNGAAVPSPDLTRNVIPLDIFPTSVVDSLVVQKSYSADKPASFGGGNVDIRTKDIPDQLTYSLEVGIGFNSETDGEALSYSGGGDDVFGTDDGSRAMPKELSAALDRFLGRLDVNSIRNTLIAEGNVYSSPREARAAAESLNRNLALELNRDIAIEEDSTNPDSDIRASVGNRFNIDDKWELGFLASGSYKSRWREGETTQRIYGDPKEQYGIKMESTSTVDITGSLNVGVSYSAEHTIGLTSLFLRNTDDTTYIKDFFNENSSKSDGAGFRDYSIRYEERELFVNQLKGTHSIGGETKSSFGNMLNWVPEELVLDWYFSDSTATTDIPNEVVVQAFTDNDPATGEVLDSSIRMNNGSASFRFTELEDEVRSYGWTATLPIEFSASVLELSGGYAYREKGRMYKETRFGLGILEVSDDAILKGPLDAVFSDENILNPENNYSLVRAGIDNRSYIAATTTDAVFGKVDWTYNEVWRVSAGARWEDYNQVALDWNPYGYTIQEPQVTTDPEELVNSVFREDKIYPALSLTYMSDFWAETFQLRLAASQTAVRPDLREITDAVYLDPITGERVSGNSSVRPSEITSFDIRAEWFFGNGDSLTVSTFYKEITDPIEFFEKATSDTDIGREIINAKSGELIGVELEGLKTMSFLGETMDGFFLQGNVTVQDAELVAGVEADSPTNDVRSMAGASDYVVNILVGFDSPDGNHSATMGYNVFGERLYLAGRLGSPDAFEQPFHSLDMTYFWYPIEEVTVKLKMQNLLDQSVEIERDGVTVFERAPGKNFALSVEYKF